ncbi:MAG: MBL fold metallo-hydrolase [Steroidobacteraceae bacterium]
MRPDVTPFHHPPTGSWTYVAADPATKAAVIVDPVLDYDGRAARTATRSAEAVAAHCEERGLRVRWILETHAHADHLSAAQYLKGRLGAQVAIGEGIRSVQATFKKVFGLGDEFVPDGRQFDRLLADGETLEFGGSTVRVIAVPGHTNDSVAYLVDDALFVGDTVFMPDSGSARCDFPGGDARALYRSVQRLYALPAETRVFVCHDYGQGGRAPLCETTIAEQKASNTHLRDGVGEDAYVEMRTTRDASLDVPILLIPSVQVNIRGGRLPPPEADGTSYLRVPLNLFGRAG